MVARVYAPNLKQSLSMTTGIAGLYTHPPLLLCLQNLWSYHPSPVQIVTLVWFNEIQNWRQWPRQTLNPVTPSVVMSWKRRRWAPLLRHGHGNACHANPGLDSCDTQLLSAHGRGVKTACGVTTTAVEGEWRALKGWWFSFESTAFGPLPQSNEWIFLNGRTTFCRLRGSLLTGLRSPTKVNLLKYWQQSCECRGVLTWTSILSQMGHDELEESAHWPIKGTSCLTCAVLRSCCSFTACSYLYFSAASSSVLSWNPSWTKRQVQLFLRRAWQGLKGRECRFAAPPGDSWSHLHLPLYLHTYRVFNSACCNLQVFCLKSLVSCFVAYYVFEAVILRLLVYECKANSPLAPDTWSESSSGWGFWRWTLESARVEARLACA